MKRSTIEKAATFFYPFLKEEAYVVFYGGEPLLAYDNIKYAVSLLQEKNREGEKKLKFSLTTNGSLITDEILHFFADHRFKVMLSYDGLAQDITRKFDSLTAIRSLVKRFQGNSHPGIEFSTNSVFTPATVNYLSASLQHIIESGVTDVEFKLAQNIPWDETALLSVEKELERLSDFLVSYYKKNGIIPVRNFRKVKPRPKSNKTFYCAGGSQRMAITPGENIWGCSVFHDYLKSRKDSSDFRTYRFGKLDEFIKNHEMIYPRILTNYAALRQDYFFTEHQFCFLCEEVGSCGVCPVNAAYATSFIGKISPWVCRLKGLLKKEKRSFLEVIDKIKPKS